MKIRSGMVLASRLFLVLMIFTGCSPGSATMKTQAPISLPPEVASVPSLPSKEYVDVTVLYHVWGAILSYGTEVSAFPGYAAYTYVLFKGNQLGPDSMEWKRYEEMLKAVLQDVKPKDIGAAVGWPQNETNIFCLPLVTKNPQPLAPLKSYDFSLAQRYLAELQTAVKNNHVLFERLERQPGPFLVSLYEPLPKLHGREATKMLYLDLTSMPQDGMRQVLDAYKERLTEAPLKNVEKLKESLKIVLLKYMLMIDENLQLVEVVFAGLN
jgi:hypothetical protein